LVAADGDRPAVSVSVVKVEKDFSFGYIKRAGSITAIRKVRISSEVGGMVERLFFERGDRVKRGQILAEIGTSKIRLEVEQALTALKAAEIQLEKVKKGSRAEEIAISEAALKEADAALRESEEHFRRIEALYGKSAVSTSEYDSALRAVESTRSRRAAMVQQLSWPGREPGKRTGQSPRLRLHRQGPQWPSPKIDFSDQLSDHRLKEL